MLDVQLSELQEQQESLAQDHWATTSYITTEEQEREYLNDNPYIGAFVLDLEESFVILGREKDLSWQ